MGGTIYLQLVALAPLLSPMEPGAATKFSPAEIADAQEMAARQWDGQNLGRRPDRCVTVLRGEAPAVGCALTRVGQLSTEELSGAHHFVSNAGASVFLFI